MRLITRADLDGVVSAVLITQMEDIQQVVYAQPQDIEDGTVTVEKGDAIANLSYHPNAALWFDHHDRAESITIANPNLKGKWGVAPSASRLIYQYYNSPRLAKFAEIIDLTDKFDSGQLTIDDVLNPKGMVLLGFTLDPYMGLAAFTGFANEIAAAIRHGSPTAQILDMPTVRARIQLYTRDATEFTTELTRISKLDGSLLITDARREDPLPAGNRFMAFALFPDASLQIVLTHHSAKEKVRVRVAKSIFNRSSKLHLGKLLAEYGGGGLEGAAGCLLDSEDADRKISELIGRLKS